MDTNEVFKKLDTIENLPTLPIVAQQVLRLIGNSNSNMSQIATVISKDQAIAAKVIKLINSAFYGFRNRVNSIQQAIVILGLNTVKNIVLGVSIVKMFEDNAQASIFDREYFWLHTFSTALGAKLTAKYLGRDNVENYFLAGLLHDIGILALDQYLHDKFVEILDKTSLDGNCYLDTEREVLGTNHGEIGAYLARKWKLPDFLVHSIQFHHAPSLLSTEADVHKDTITLTHISDVHSLEMGYCRFIYAFRPGRDSDIFRSISISPVKRDEINDQVQQDVVGLMKEWGI